MTTFTHGYALLIGVGRTDYSPWSLPVTVNDARSLHRLLTDAQRCAYADDDDHMRLLHDETATRDAILDGLRWLCACAQADPEATIVIFYSGHGWLEAQTGLYYLIPHDVKPTRQAPTALSGADFTSALRAIPARRLLTILDCCHAGGMAVAKDAPPEWLPQGYTLHSAPKELVEALKQGAGRAVFLSSLGSESSWVGKDGKLSVYTAHLLEGLMGAGNAIGETEVRLSHLMGYLSQRVPASVRSQYQESQTPYFDMATEDFPVALIRAGKGLPAGGWSAEKPAAAEVIRRITRSLSIRGDDNMVVTGNVNNSQVGHHNTRVDTGGAAYIAGNVVQGPGSTFVGGDQVNYGLSPSSLERVFAPLAQAVERLADAEARQDAQNAVNKLQAEAARGEQADEGKVERWFNFLIGMSDDIREVAITTFSNPVAGIALIFQKVARKARELSSHS